MLRKSDKIRIGIIRCDTHGFWYAHLFQKPDATLMRKNNRGCHYYFYERDDPGALRLKPIPGMVVTRTFDEERPVEAEKLAEALGTARACKTFDEVSDDVDLVYIADCNFEGKDHLRYARPGLRKGVPHFVDKPLAFTLKDARAIIELAKKHRTAVMCASLLRYSPQLERFGRRLADVAPVSRVDIPSIGPTLAGVYHGVSAAQNIMGEGCRWVESMGPEVFDIMRLGYPGPEGGTDVFIFNAMGRVPNRVTWSSTYPHCELFLASAYGANGAIHAPRIGDYEYPYGGVRIVKLARRLAQSKKPVIDYAAMLEPMEIVEAARLAHNTGNRVGLEEVRS